MKNKVLLEDMRFIAKNFNNADAFRNKTILITGGAGFLGFYLVHFFVHAIESGLNIKSIYILDNFILRKPKWLDEIVQSYRKVKVLHFDISRDTMNNFKMAKDVDYIFHMASIASPAYYRKFPIHTIEANVLGLRNLLEYYKRRRLKGFLFFSSSEIYGDPDHKFIPTQEEYRGNVSCLGPRACYDEAKRLGETLCYVYAKVHGVPVTIVRPFNNYGPGMSLEDKRVPADFAKSIILGKDITIYSDGTPRRTFCYIADAIVGYLKAIAYGKFEYFNIGADKPEISIKSLAKIYKKQGRLLCAYRGKITYAFSKDSEYMTDNPTRRCPDISKARRLLNFNPKINIEEGVGKLLEFLKEGRLMA